MPTDEDLKRSHHALLNMREHPGSMVYNAQRGLWFYTIQQQWKRAIVGQGETPEEAIEQAIKQLQDS